MWFPDILGRVKFCEKSEVDLPHRHERQVSKESSS